MTHVCRDGNHLAIGRSSSRRYVTHLRGPCRAASKRPVGFLEDVLEARIPSELEFHNLSPGQVIELHPSGEDGWVGGEVVQPKTEYKMKKNLHSHLIVSGRANRTQATTSKVLPTGGVCGCGTMTQTKVGRDQRIELSGSGVEHGYWVWTKSSKPRFPLRLCAQGLSSTDWA